MTTDIKKYSFLITGGAGFIGSAIVEELIKNEVVKVRVLDNLATGNYDNIKHWVESKKVEFIKGDIRNIEDCMHACEGIDYISHQAALGSVPRSINDPITSHQVNTDGFLNVLEAAKKNNIKRIVYASSSSIYGDNPILPKKEESIGEPLSPYAITKKINELYASIYANVYGMNIVGLRYFNVFGPRQNPQGEYAAVIPKFIASIQAGIPPDIHGDGEQGRDFTYIDNAVEANIKAMLVDNPEIIGRAFNIACGERITVNKIFQLIANYCESSLKPNYVAKRQGDVRDSWADISTSEKILGYKPVVTFDEGLKRTVKWYTEHR